MKKLFFSPALLFFMAIIMLSCEKEDECETALFTEVILEMGTESSSGYVSFDLLSYKGEIEDYVSVGENVEYYIYYKKKEEQEWQKVWVSFPLRTESYSYDSEGNIIYNLKNNFGIDGLAENTAYEAFFQVEDKQKRHCHARGEKIEFKTTPFDVWVNDLVAPWWYGFYEGQTVTLEFSSLNQNDEVEFFLVKPDHSDSIKVVPGIIQENVLEFNIPIVFTEGDQVPQYVPYKEYYVGVLKNGTTYNYVEPGYPPKILTIYNRNIVIENVRDLKETETGLHINITGLFGGYFKTSNNYFIESGKVSIEEVSSGAVMEFPVQTTKIDLISHDVEDERVMFISSMESRGPLVDDLHHAYWWGQLKLNKQDLSIGTYKITMTLNTSDQVSFISNTVEMVVE